jgi:hypothetical protein
MKTKLKHFFLLSAVVLAATACGSSLAKPVSGLDVTMLPTRMLSIDPKAPDAEADAVEPAPLRLSGSKTTNQTSTVNH